MKSVKLYGDLRPTVFDGGKTKLFVCLFAE